MKRRKFATDVYWCFCSVSTSSANTAKQREKTAKNKHKIWIPFSLKSDIYIVSFRYTHSEKSIQVATKPLQFSQVRGCEHTRENNSQITDNVSREYIKNLYLQNLYIMTNHVI